MANAIYPAWKDALMTGAANAILTGSGITGLYCVLVDTALYTYSDAHAFYTSLAGISGTEQEVTAVTVSAGVVDGNNISYPLIAPGPSIEALVLYRKNAGPSSSWRLVTYLDSGVTGLPAVMTGGNVSITWSASGIFRL